MLVVIWQGLQHLLLKPLQTIMNHIRTIAAGDLTQDITLSGRNEMGQLAAGLHEMQQSLVTTVSAVRGSTDSIYTGAGEIAAGATIFPPVRKNRPPRWKRPQPAWKS